MSYTPKNPNGQATKANSSPVVIASDQDVLATSAKQDTLLTELQLKADLTETQPVSLASFPSHAVTNAGTFAVQNTAATPAGTNNIGDVDVLTVNGVAPAFGTGVRGATVQRVTIATDDSVPVTGTFFQATQPVSAVSLPLPTGAATSALQTQPGVDIGDVTVNNAAGASAVNIQDGGNSITVDGTVAVSGTVAVTDNAGSLTVDAPVGTPAFVRLSDGAAAITTLPVSLASVPSHAVTNAGTFLVQNNAATPAGTNNIGDVDVLTINGVAPAFGTGVRGATVQRVTIATDDVVPASQSGTWTVQPGNTANTTPWIVTDSPATSGGLSKFHLVSAATTNATNIKASAGQVYSITAFNLNASPRYVKFHNTAGTPTAGTAVTDSFLIPGNTAGAGMVINIDKGIVFSTGIAITTVTEMADSGTTAIAANELLINIYYK